MRQIEGGLPDDFALADNQNQNQGDMAALAEMKPEVLRSIGVGRGMGETAEDNQNQNQGKLEDLIAMKPQALQSLRSVLLAPGDEVMDNQNQNQGGNVRGIAKPE
ncbi:hypothetical protein CKO32_09725 [Afifella marina DSM 2698]|nr:hypothetical protein [Afifella marina DSM 2698]MBK1627241.1 hypothetical protein [Afifella marina]MBK5918730.1 hypothetical protein [Afifella marina]RAI22657.1 hypothetical protein CH311_03035 [Afifella marina DSM 2698]